MKKCPFCAEEIQDEAVKCKHCGEFLDGKGHIGTNGPRWGIIASIGIVLFIIIAAAIFVFSGTLKTAPSLDNEVGGTVGAGSSVTQLRFEHYVTGMGAGLRLSIPIPEPSSVCTWNEWRSNKSGRPTVITTRSDADSGHERFYDYEPWRQYVVEASCKGSSGQVYNVDRVKLNDLGKAFNPNE